MPRLRIDDINLSFGRGEGDPWVTEKSGRRFSSGSESWRRSQPRVRRGRRQGLVEQVTTYTDGTPIEAGKTVIYSAYWTTRFCGSTCCAPLGASIAATSTTFDPTVQGMPRGGTVYFTAKAVLGTGGGVGALSRICVGRSPRHYGHLRRYKAASGAARPGGMIIKK